MKKLYLLIAGVTFAGFTWAQTPIELGGEIPQSVLVKPHANITKGQNEVQSVSSSFHVDYQVSDELFQGGNGTMQGFAWSSRYNWTGTYTTGSYRHQFTTVTLDTLVENSLIFHDWNDILTYDIDSVFFYVSHINRSGNMNKLQFRLINMGVNGYADESDVVLWTDSVMSDTTAVTGATSWLGAFKTYSFTPNITGLTKTDRVALLYRFYGSDGDTSGTVSTYPMDGSCAAISPTPRAKASAFWPNSFNHWYQPGINTEPTWPAPGANYNTGSGILYYDCDGSSSYDVTIDSQDLTQNGSFWFYVTIDECDLNLGTAVTTGDGGGCVGVAAANATGDAQPYTYLWDSNTGNQTTQSATGLCYNQNYCVTVTNQDGCTKVSCITMSPPIGINETPLSYALNVYPNPSNGQFTVSLNGVGQDTYTFTITNVLGEIVYTEKTIVSGDYIKEIDFNDIGKGVYFLNVSSSTNKTTQKLVVE